MGRMGKDKERIVRLFAMNGMEYTSKTYANIRFTMETFAMIKNDLEYLPKEKSNSLLSNEVAHMFRAMIVSGRIPKEKVERFIGVVTRSGHLQEMIDTALKLVRDFSDDGEMYYQLLNMLYFIEKPLPNIVVERKCNYSHSTFQKKKELAVMLFGVLFWKEMLEYWENSEEEMYVIEKEEGRDGSLAKGRKDFIEKRNDNGDRRKEGSDRRRGIGDRRKCDRRIGIDRRGSSPAYGI